ncbi:uncharacterized protein LOC110241315 [Exaiptasia diaphana]|uniref:Uncharacterized protein n=1 Tax=Exaiptasia diaphana TaxID=2652724 RepID=A0A913XEE0_EXADI|nr:uncharacterized protein LOC110241315 [Exaiptasia diaphana]
MTSSFSTRWAAILIFLFLGQEFCAAILPAPDLGIQDRAIVKSSAAHISGLYASCKIFKTAFYSYLYKHWNCMGGITALRDLYNQRMKHFEGKTKCNVGDFDTVKQKLIEFGKERGFLINCIQIKTKVCSLAQKGYSKLFIANSLHLTIEQVDYLLRSCREPALTDVQKEAVCLMKKYGLTALRIAKLLGPVFKESTVQSHMDTC